MSSATSLVRMVKACNLADRKMHGKGTCPICLRVALLARLRSETREKCFRLQTQQGQVSPEHVLTSVWSQLKTLSLCPVRTHQACVFLEDELLEHLFNGEGDNALLQLQVDLSHLLVATIYQVVEAVDEVYHLKGRWIKGDNHNPSRDLEFRQERSDFWRTCVRYNVSACWKCLQELSIFFSKSSLTFAYLSHRAL